VIAGAALGVASSFYFTPKPFASNQALVMPLLDGKRIGLFWMKPIQ
jgi:hypothetical protein